MKSKKILLNLIPLFTVVGVVLIYSLSALAVDNEFVLPKFSLVLKETLGYFALKEFYSAFFSTLLRSVISFAVCFVLATVCAVLSDKSVVTEKILTPVISVLRALPTVAVVLLLLFWTNGYIAPVVVTALVIFPTLFTNAKNVVKSVDKEVVSALKVYNVPEKKIIFKVIIPQMLPQMIYSAGSGLSLNLKLMVAAEVLASTADSLGIMINLSNYNLEIAKMMALVLITVVVGVVIDVSFAFISKKVGKWQ